MNIRKIFRKLRGLSTREWRDMIAAQRAIISAQMSVWLRSKGNLVSALPQDTEVNHDKSVDPRVVDLGRAVDRAASFGFVRAQCLVRSMALARLMASRGFHGAVVRVGVTRKNDKMLAHAWIEYNGFVVGDKAEYVSRFDQLPGIDVET